MRVPETSAPPADGMVDMSARLAEPSRSQAHSAETSDVESTNNEEGSKSRRRRLFGFGKKKDEDKANKDNVGNPATKISPVAIAQSSSRKAPPLPYQSPSPPQTGPYQVPGSPPNRNLSSSPRVVSPAGSQIFERNVQESSSLPGPNSPAIPSHIQRENHIPPVLDASSEAITNNTLDPDTVEIVMASAHQPAALTVTGIGSESALSGSWTDDLQQSSHHDDHETASNYGSLDNGDVRRLSFISFADVVQTEHAEQAGSRDSFHVAGLSCLSSQNANRSPSPVRSPVSSQGFSVSPPTSQSASVKGVEMSPVRKPLANPIAMPNTGCELTVETMTQALRKTGSGDLSAGRSPQPMSPVSGDGMSDRDFR